MGFSRIGSKDRLVDRVVDHLQEMIVFGKLQPGDKLPPERELGEQLGVSRTVTREAVRILAAKGLVETKRGVGTTVSQLTKDHIVEPLSMLLQTQWGGISVEHLHQVRQMIEVEISGLAAQLATEADIAELEERMAELDDAQSSPDAYADADALFHQALSRATHNPLLVILLDSIGDLLFRVRLFVHRHPDLVQQTMRDHTLILECVKNRDAAGARQAMEAHLLHAREIQKMILQESELESIANDPADLGR